MKLKDTGLTAQDIKDKVNKYMIETYERFDFLAETAEGMYLYDENGTPYLDFYAGIAVNNAGSRNPKVVAAVKDQMDDIMHTFNYPYTIPQALLAEKVCETIGMDKIFFQNSGTEANEAMIKMARKYGIDKYGPNKYHIVTAKMGFHGRTFGAMSATGQPGNGCQVGFGPMTYGFSYAPYNDLKAFKDACTENTIAIMIDWRIAVVVWGGFLILTALTRYVSLGSLWAGASFPFISWYCYPQTPIIVLAFCLGGLIVWKHRANIQRLLAGNENKLSFHRKKS